MSFLLQTLSNNKARSLKDKSNKEAPQLTCGTISSDNISKPTIVGENTERLKLYNIKTKHLIMLLINATLGRQGFDDRLHPEYYLVAGNTKTISTLLNISIRSATRGIKELVDEGSIEVLGTVFSHKLLGVRKDSEGPHYSKYAIPVIAVIADMPIAFKKFLVKAHMCTESNTNKEVVLKNESTMRLLSAGSGKYTKTLLATLDSNGWLERSGGLLKINLEQIYTDLSNRYFYRETTDRMNKQ